ncbi:hypothetical protein [Cohnella candidum]|uniref:Uncharacterized protein n=1 Tax=Cohnella candidum TaxID=2674991 RepID=A0A3G3JXA6_9BACL|nr:hypothetical protein [Cohnella candidum]AYQ72866.1 hypothetical protein EAV92_10010 [Cohnella candidum]
MPFPQWLSRWLSPSPHPPDPYPALAARLADIERRLDKLTEDRCSETPHVFIEHADRVVVERVVYSNHFGTLEVDSLEGQLNIGLNYRGEPHSPDELPPFVKTKDPHDPPDSARPASSRPKPPKVHIKPRK